jgi:hypothetical protein
MNIGFSGTTGSLRRARRKWAEDEMSGSATTGVNRDGAATSIATIGVPSSSRVRRPSGDAQAKTSPSAATNAAFG